MHLSVVGRETFPSGAQRYVILPVVCDSRGPRLLSTQLTRRRRICEVSESGAERPSCSRSYAPVTLLLTAEPPVHIAEHLKVHKWDMNWGVCQAGPLPLRFPPAAAASVESKGLTGH